MSEKAPLTGEFLPPRASSGRGIQDLETYGFGAVVLMGVASGVMCVVYTISHHPEHMAGAIAVFINLALLLLMGRAYRRDDIQDRKIIYLVVLSSLSLYIMAIIYVAQWGTCSTGGGSGGGGPAVPSNCPSNTYNNFYSSYVRDPKGQPGVGTCLAFSRLNPTTPCFVINQNSTSRFNGTAMDTSSPYVTGLSFGLTEANRVWNACFSKAGVKNALPQL